MSRLIEDMVVNGSWIPKLELTQYTGFTFISSITTRENYSDIDFKNEYEYEFSFEINKIRLKSN